MTKQLWYILRSIAHKKISTSWPALSPKTFSALASDWSTPLPATFSFVLSYFNPYGQRVDARRERTKRRRFTRGWDKNNRRVNKRASVILRRIMLAAEAGGGEAAVVTIRRHDAPASGGGESRSRDISYGGCCRMWAEGVETLVPSKGVRSRRKCCHNSTFCLGLHLHRLRVVWCTLRDDANFK